MQTITQNFGLAGGTLDATRHLARAIPKSCTQQEIHASQQMLAILAAKRQLNSASRN